MAPVAEEINRGINALMVRSIINTSSEKITAAIGALKMAAMAPEAPAPTKTIMVLRLR